MNSVDVAIITIKDVERDEVLALLPEHTEVPPRVGESRFYYSGQLPAGQGGHHTVVCTKTLQQGNVSIVSTVRDVVERWHPKVVLLVGIGGGIGSEIEIGDVVVASQIFYYEPGKVTRDGTIRRLEAYRPSARLLMAADAVRDGAWAAATRRPSKVSRDARRFVGPLGSGEKVIADANADETAFLRAVSDKVAAVDMEAAGIASAVYEGGGPEFLVIRGISDLANRDKDDEYQPYAARCAATFAAALLAKLSSTRTEQGRATALVAVLAHCPLGLPVEVLASASGQPNSELLHELHELARGGKLRFDEQAQWVEPQPTNNGEQPPSPPDSLTRAVLEETLEYVARRPLDKGTFRVLPTIVELAKACASRYPGVVARVFKAIEKPPLKTLGNKRLILELARLSSECARHPARTKEEAELEAQAIICGVSWVYQRTGRLTEAVAEAERSRDLGRQIHYDRNTAFCQKCIGRLYRLQAEAVSGPARAELLAKSAASIRDAIDGFSRHPDFGPDHPEIGACQSLMARTLLVANDLRGARKAVDDASALLTKPTDKDYLDLSIVLGEIEFASGDRARALKYVGSVIGQPVPTECERSEVLARAHLTRGKFHAAMGMKNEALADFEKARAISAGLEEHEEVARAEWLAADARGEITADMHRALGHDPYAVRMRVVARLGEQRTGPHATLARRSKMTAQQWARLRNQAQEQLAVEVPSW